MHYTVPKVYFLVHSSGHPVNQTEVNGQKKSGDRDTRPKFAKSSHFPSIEGGSPLCHSAISQLFSSSSERGEAGWTSFPFLSKLKSRVVSVSGETSCLTKSRLIASMFTMAADSRLGATCSMLLMVRGHEQLWSVGSQKIHPFLFFSSYETAY